MIHTENKPQHFELGDILREHAADFLSSHTLCPVQLKALHDIMACRTAEMKGHMMQCNQCGYREQSYNSCRNRHCNKCQFVRQEIWADSLKGRLLPTKYFHLVFTVPDSLNPLFYLNQQLCYGLLFNVAWSALKDLCANPRFLGAQTGAVAVLHTWSSTLVYHPHVHMLVPAGGLSDDGMEWAGTKQDFLLPVKVLSKIYRARFGDQLQKMIDNKTLVLPEGTKTKALRESIFKKDWVVYTRKTGKTVDHALQYLARYSNRVAIGNQRIVKFTDGKVTFRYKDAKTGRYNREITLTATEFIRRFILHILPPGFYKIRYFGILSSVNSPGKKEQSLALIGRQPYLSHLEGLNAYEAYCIISGKDPARCKKCLNGRMSPALSNTT